MKKMKPKPTILLTNDDGINAQGLYSLYRALKPLGNCVIVAPEREISGTGHAVTMKKPIRVYKHSRCEEEYGWCVTGTPVDCIKFAVDQILDSYPDLIVSGINQGSNSAINAVYSGTVAAAAEGGIMNIPSFAVSIASYEYSDFSAAAAFAKVTAEKILQNGLPDFTFLNINVPPVDRDEIAGVRVTRMCRMRYKEFFDLRYDPAKRPYYWLKGEKVIFDFSDESDEVALGQNYITVTPLDCDMTNYEAIELINSWKLSLNELNEKL